MKSKAQQASVSPTVMRQFAQCNSHVHRLSMCCFLSKTDVFIVHILREFRIREICYVNYRVAVGLLVGQGWEQRRPTLPKLYVNKARPKVLVFLRLNCLFGRNQWLKAKLFINGIFPHIRLSTRQ